MAVVCDDPQEMVEYANWVLEIIKNDEDKQIVIKPQNVRGITTLEKVLEAILRIPILDEKDVEKLGSP
jgi:hypothetical protein